MTSPDLSGLIERVGAASGPDRDVDLVVDLHARPDQWAQVCHDNPASVPTQWCDDDELPRYTASLDATMTLVGDECFRVERHPMYGVYAFVGDHDAYAATPALALCLASLRALQEKDIEHG